MENLALFYEAFEEYKKRTSLDVESNRISKFYAAQKGPDHEEVTVTYSTCTIEEDWVEAIEKGIVFIEKAINEERQFIRNDAEVLPIEKVRKVSRTSIEDLARHSNYITHEADKNAESDVIPDKLLVIRKESDYTVYENRVLYAALVYIQEFVSSRLNKIKDLTNRFEVESYAKKHIDIGSRTLDYEFKLNEIRKNDPLISSRNKCRDIIQRLDDIMSQVIALLKRQLMVDVSKVDLVKRPITKTNVLKMNRNFRESLACFDYVASYQGEGYTIQTFTKTFTPFGLELAGAYAEVAMLTSFITYEFGNDLNEQLRKEYFEILEKRKKEEEDALLEKLKTLKIKANADGKTLAEYVQMFETGYRIVEDRLEALEEDLKNIEKIHKEEIHQIEIKHEAEVKQLNEEHEQHVKEIRYEHDQKVKEIESAHYEEVTRLNDEHEEVVKQLKSDHEYEIDELNQKHEEEVTNIKEQSENEYIALRDSKDNQIKSLTESYEAEKEEYVSKATEQINSLTNERDELEKSNKHYEKDNADYRTKVFSLLIKNKQAPNVDSFSYEETFDELEKTKQAFDSYYEDAWRRAKENIHKNAKSPENPGENAENEESKIIENVVNEKAKPLSPKEQIEELSRVNEELRKENELIKARLLAVQSKNGGAPATNSYLSEEKFDELEATKKAFDKYYEDAWKEAKKQIEKDMASLKASKQKKGNQK